MLPTQPPPLSEMDFDPDATDNEDEDDPQEPTIQISSIEVNYLVYQASLYAYPARLQLTSSIYWNPISNTPHSRY
jgi:hypothetical protein